MINHELTFYFFFPTYIWFQWLHSRRGRRERQAWHRYGPKKYVWYHNSHTNSPPTLQTHLSWILQAPMFPVPASLPPDGKLKNLKWNHKFMMSNHRKLSSVILWENYTGLSKKTLDDIEAKLCVYHIQGNLWAYKYWFSLPQGCWLCISSGPAQSFIFFCICNPNWSLRA